MLFGVDFLQGQRIALGQRGEQAAVVIAVIARPFVAVFDIKLQKAIEHNHRSGRPHLRAAMRGLNGDGGLVQFGAGHLAGHRSLPDQLVELKVFVAQPGRQIPRQARRIGRSDGFMRFLGVFGLGPVYPGFGRQIAVTGLTGDDPANGADRLLPHLNAIGPHVGDQANRLAADVNAFVKALGDAHGSGGAEA